MAPPFASAWRRAHLTDEERVARGKTARQRRPGRRMRRGSVRRTDRTRSPCWKSKPRAVSGRPSSNPVWADVGLAVHVLPGRRPHHGCRPGRAPRSGITVQLCGDAHLSNFGVLPALPSARWCSTSTTSMRRFPVRGSGMSSGWRPASRSGVAIAPFTAADRRAIVMAGVNEYRLRMRRSAGMRTLDAWYEHLEVGELLDRIRNEQRRPARRQD